MTIFHHLQFRATLTTILHTSQNPHVLHISGFPKIDTARRRERTSVKDLVAAPSRAGEMQIFDLEGNFSPRGLSDLPLAPAHTTDLHQMLFHYRKNPIVWPHCLGNWRKRAHHSSWIPGVEMPKISPSSQAAAESVMTWVVSLFPSRSSTFTWDWYPSQNNETYKSTTHTRKILQLYDSINPQCFKKRQELFLQNVLIEVYELINIFLVSHQQSRFNSWWIN